MLGRNSTSTVAVDPPVTVKNVKNGPKAKKIKLPQMNFSLKKQLIFLCTY